MGPNSFISSHNCNTNITSSTTVNAHSPTTMFNNYQELYYGYIDLYKASFYRPQDTTSSRDRYDHGQAARHSDKLIAGQSQGAPFGVHSKQSRDLQDDCLLVVDKFRPPSTNGATIFNYRASSTNPGCVNCSSSSLSSYITSTSTTITDDTIAADHSANTLIAEQLDGRLVRVGSFNSIDSSDLVYLASLFVLLVFAKRSLSRKLGQLKSIDRLGLRPKDRERLDECLWRLLFYSISSTWLMYSCLKQNSHLLLTTSTRWPTASLAAPASASIPQLRYTFDLDWSSYAILMIETSFYIHATYALIFEDIWRRDSPMMLVHHLAAAFSTLSVYSTRTHQIGLISIVLRDTCDVLLEMTKLIKCLHIQHGKRVSSLGVALKCFLTIFALAFAVNQLYYYPLYCLYHALNMVKLFSIQTPTIVALLTCGLIFLLLDILWFGLILRLLYIMVFLGRPLKDIREYDDEDEDILNSSSESFHKSVDSDNSVTQSVDLKDKSV